jgi:hypothetical protein
MSSVLGQPWNKRLGMKLGRKQLTQKSDVQVTPRPPAASTPGPQDGSAEAGVPLEGTSDSDNDGSDSDQYAPSEGDAGNTGEASGATNTGR